MIWTHCVYCGAGVLAAPDDDMPVCSEDCNAPTMPAMAPHRPELQSPHPSIRSSANNAMVTPHGPDWDDCPF